MGKESVKLWLEKGRRTGRSLWRTVAPYEHALLLALGILLVSAAAFIGGVLVGDARSQADPAVVTVEKCTTPPPSMQGGVNVDEQNVGNKTLAKKSNGDQQEGRDIATALPTACAFVGSKNSTKYYPPTCKYAKRIKKENLRCFPDAQSAESAGYVRSACD